MTPQSCQFCAHVGVWLEHVSAAAYADYYRCASGHVWAISRDKDQYRHDVTPPTEASCSVALGASAWTIDVEMGRREMVAARFLTAG